MLLWIVGSHLATRLAYVGWVGIALTRQRRLQAASGDREFPEEFEEFRERASLLMTLDAATFILLCLITRQTMVLAIPRPIVWTAAALLIVVGIGIKVWAAKTLGRKAYYWHNFFAADTPPSATSPGPYRYISNPMYTVGYLQAYGLALAVGSLAGVVAALFDQAAILAFHQLVEKPHYQALQIRAASPAPASPSAAP